MKRRRYHYVERDAAREMCDSEAGILSGGHARGISKPRISCNYGRTHLANYSLTCGCILKLEVLDRRERTAEEYNRRGRGRGQRASGKRELALEAPSRAHRTERPPSLGALDLSLSTALPHAYLMPALASSVLSFSAALLYMYCTTIECIKDCFTKP